MRKYQTAFLCLLLLALAGCAHTPKSVLDVACDRAYEYSVERCAKAAGDVYEVYQKRAEQIVADPLTPADVVSAVRKVEGPATEVMVNAQESNKLYISIKQQLAAGATTEDKLAIAERELEAWLQQALPRINALIAALGG